MRHKIVKIILILLAFIIAIWIFFVAQKIEAPLISDEVSEVEIKGDSLLVEDVEIAKIESLEKYIIKSRSVVSPVDNSNTKKIVLLTIDDGPTKRTLEVMEILKKHDAKAIFFINGMFDKNNKGIISQIIKEGFVVGNHTWSHLNLKKEKDINIIEREIVKNSNLIKKETGESPRFFRAPYGESNVAIRKRIKDDGMIFMDWSSTAKDWEASAKDEKVFIDNVVNNLHSGSIILIHEHFWSVLHLDALLTTLESKGYSYVDPKNIIE